MNASGNNLLPTTNVATPRDARLVNSFTIASPKLDRLWRHRHTVIAVVTVVCITVYLLLRFGLYADESTARWFLWIVLAVGGGPLVAELAVRAARREFGSDLLAGISIVTAVILGEYLA